MELRIVILDRDRIRRRLVCEAASVIGGLRVVGEAASCEDAGVCAGADVFLINAALVRAERDALDGLVAESPGSCVVLYSAQPDLDSLIAAGRLPVRGVLAFNHLAGREFARALEVIAHGGAVIEPRSAQLLLEYVARMGVPVGSGRLQFELSGREAEVLELVRAGLSNKEIALRLRLSLGTVRGHLRSIFRKLDVRSRAGAAALATGLIRSAG